MALPSLRARAFRIFATALAAAAVCLVGSGTATAAPDQSGGAGIVEQPLTAPGGVFAGRQTLVKGHIDDYAGPVSITARNGEKGDFLPVATASADADGDFSFRWKPGTSGRYSFRVSPSGPATASATALATSGALSVYRRQKSTWYGPGFYGNRTACGQKLTRRTLGVAHKTLPCGTKVEFYLRGKSITVPVIDRGPYANAAVWDLTLAAMRRLGSSSTEFVGALVIR